MSRQWRTTRKKSPSPDSDDSIDFKRTARKPAGSGFLAMLGEGSGSPVLTHRTVSAAAQSGFSGGGLGASYALSLKATQQKSLLQSVVQNIVGLDDDYDRQIQRKKLESDLEVTSERLESLVYEHRDKLHGTLATFDAVDKKIKASQAKVRQVKASLISCKHLLRCKREELKKLWLDDLKYKHMLQMLDSIEEIRAVPERLVKLKSTKHYLAATELLMNSVARLERELSSVEALKGLKSELLQQKSSLHEELIDELHTHVYVKASAAASKPQIGRRTGAGDSDVSSMVPTKKSSTLTRTSQMNMRGAESSVTPPIAEETMGELEEVEEGRDPEEDSGRYMGVLVQALSRLGRVNEALEAVHDRMEREFLLIIERASIQVSRARDNEEGQRGRKGRGYVKENVPKLLTKMLQSCFVRFQCVVHAHQVLLTHLHRVKRMYKASYELYEKSTVWGSIQRVVQNALEIYLACEEDGAPGDGLSGFSAFTNPGDTQSVFFRRKPMSGRVFKKPLFKFDGSRHAISISSYMREQRDLELTGSVAGGVSSVVVHHFEHNQPSIAQHLVCKPHYRNVTVVFRVVRDFIDVVEEELDLDEDSHCELHSFFHDYVRNSFLQRIRYEYMEKMSTCAKPEAGKVTASDQRTSKVTGSKLCVLNSVLTVWQLVEELRQLMKDLPLYAPHFMDILCELLIGYKDSLKNLYSGITSVPIDAHQSGGRHAAAPLNSYEGVVSNNMAADRELWKNIHLVKGRVDEETTEAVEDERHQSSHHREVLELVKKITEPLSRHNVIPSHDSLRLLGILHESLDWFSDRLCEVKEELKSHMEDVDGSGISRHLTPPPSDLQLSSEDLQQLIQGFASIQKEIQDMSEVTIVHLHLEVRCHCFYYLLPVLHKSSYVFSQNEEQKEDEAVSNLSKDLRDIDLVMVAVLTATKYHYLFEGLGHLLAAIFINCTKHITVINTSGVKKMCRNISVLQSCLSKITLIREKELDRARKYFEMLYLSFDEMMEGIHEQGLLYEEDDYKRIITILPQKNKGDKLSEKEREDIADMLQDQFKQLHDAFSTDTV